jgi:hypothetical protein
VAHEKLLQGRQLLAGAIEIVGRAHEGIVRARGRRESRCRLILAYVACDSMSPQIYAWYKSA